MTVAVELFAGLAAWTLHLHGRRPLASRIGAKTGYAAEISKALGVEAPPSRVLLVDADPLLVNALEGLLHRPADLYRLLPRVLDTGATSREIWQAAREWRKEKGSLGAISWWVWTAGARGGIGGFKGAHKLRPKVDGFIPSLSSLAKRLSAFEPMPHVEVLFNAAEEVPPIPGAVVYLDPPYEGTVGYGLAPGPTTPVLCDLARRWHDAGCRVAVSYDRPLPLDGWPLLDLTHARRGQTRRSLTRSAAEWLALSPEAR